MDRNSCEKRIDFFQRRLLRTYILNVKWPDIVTNDNVYLRMKAKPWSIYIRKRRLRWLGHVMRIPDSTPVRKSLEYAQHPYQETTWQTKIHVDVINFKTIIKRTFLDIGKSNCARTR